MMEWLNKMNDALDYIETHLDEKLDYAQAARIACCSLSRFQRMFTFVTDITIAEYVRCRRMALAAGELVSSDIKVIDLALNYGYDSPEAFTRAFQTFHGVSPSTARKLGIYTHYPRISFQININGGNVNMGTKPVVRIEEHTQEKVVSFYVDCTGPEGAAWDLLRAWVTSNISDYKARRYLGCAPKGHHPEGEAHQVDEEIGRHPYQAQMFLFGGEGQEATFLGAEVTGAPQGLYLVGDVVLNEFNADGSIDIGTSMQKSAGVMMECLKEFSGYELALQERPYFEEHIFSNEWFAGAGELAGFKLWLPIKKI